MENLENIKSMIAFILFVTGSAFELFGRRGTVLIITAIYLLVS